MRREVRCGVSSCSARARRLGLFAFLLAGLLAETEATEGACEDDLVRRVVVVARAFLPTVLLTEAAATEGESDDALVERRPLVAEGCESPAPASLVFESLRVSSCPARAEARVSRFTGMLAEAEVEVKESTPEDALVWRRVSVARERGGCPDDRVFLSAAMLTEAADELVRSRIPAATDGESVTFSACSARGGRPEARVILLVIAMLAGSEVEAVDSAFADDLVRRRVPVATEGESASFSPCSARGGCPEARVFFLVIALLAGSEVEAADSVLADALVRRRVPAATEGESATVSSCSTRGGRPRIFFLLIALLPESATVLVEL